MANDDFFMSFDDSQPAKPTSRVVPAAASASSTSSSSSTSLRSRRAVGTAPPPPPGAKPARPATTTTTTIATTTRSAPTVPTPSTPTTAKVVRSAPSPVPPQPAAAAAASSNGSRPVASGSSSTVAQRPVTASATSLRRPNSASAAGTGATNAAAAAAPNSYYGTTGTTPVVRPKGPNFPAPNPAVFQQQHQQNNTATTVAQASPTYYGAAQQQQPQQNQQPQQWSGSGVGGTAITQPTIPAAPTSGDWYAAEAAGPVDPSQLHHRPVQHAASAYNTMATTMNPLYATTTIPSAAPGFVGLSGFEGAMDSNGASSAGSSLTSHATTTPSIFVPNMSQQHAAAPTSTGSEASTGSNSKQYYHDEIDFENEPPLLEELGINIDHIWLKTKAVVLPFKFRKHDAEILDPALIVQDADLAGPLAFALLLGGELLLSGKLQFGYIYGFGLFGCLSMTLILNLMSPTQAVSVWTVTSILGYALLPVNILAALKIVLVNIARLSTLGRLLGILAVVWSTIASTRLLEIGCGMADQRYLMAYPIALLYSAFVLITIF